MNLIGKFVTITNRQSWAYDQWGIVKYFDGTYYHIALYNGTETLVFERNEFRVRRNTK